MAEVVLLIWLAFFVLMVTVVAFCDIPVHWGHAGMPAGPQMSRLSRVVFCATVWTMFGVILAGVSGSDYLQWMLKAMFACVAASFVCGALDKRNASRQGDDGPGTTSS